MKIPVRLLTLILITLLAAGSANCVQKLQPASPTATATPSAVLTPQPTTTSSPAPTPAYVSPHQFSIEEAYALGNIAIGNPYVQKRCISVGWRDISDVPVKVADVLMMPVHEKAPGYDVVRSLPAVIIAVGNESQAGINVVTYLDGNRVAYVGFIPRAGVNTTGATYYSTERGVGERIPGHSVDRFYENVTILDTGYVHGQNLSETEEMVIRSIAAGNDSVKKLIRDRPYVIRSVTVTCIERGYPDRYIEAYPTVTFDVKEDGSLIDSFDVLIDGRNGRVLGISHKSPYEY
ncbi:hypothetical protein [Methanocella arvoryzae]|uniref:Uncharacterized protein n=1 Tax=Methanocella arvoryzae (strain DSM 22066 / NBRC 105507 / MRE50) TaxID=351160 RepID=Q0W8F8_METAR|nr:hypothetical protein [Methanocella arvoryzae]CAJ35335.1 hypothetical protein LRC370 [Methanocella arvoryzae MRE50]